MRLMSGIEADHDAVIGTARAVKGQPLRTFESPDQCNTFTRQARGYLVRGFDDCHNAP